MKCSKIRLNLQDYLDNNLREQIMHDIAAHLEGCPECSAELAFIKKFHRRTKQLPKLEAPVNLLANIHRQLAEAEAAPKKFSWVLPLPVQLTGVAGVLTVIMIMFFIFNPMKPEEPPLFKTMNQEINTNGAKNEAPSADLKTPTKPIVKKQKPEIEPQSNLSMNVPQIVLRMTEPSNESDIALEKSNKGIASKALSPELPDSIADRSLERSTIQDQDVSAELRKSIQAYQGQILNEETDQTTGKPQKWSIKLPGKEYLLFLNDLYSFGIVTKPTVEQKLPDEIVFTLEFQYEP